MTNTLKLKAAIVGSGLNQEQVAENLEMTIATLNYKINNKSEFRASEIKKLSEVLNLTNEEVNAIFFAEKVE
jgi:transcriptional regulator with XRE-family HTH domain